VTSGAKFVGEVVSIIAANGSGFHVEAGTGGGAGGLVALRDGETDMLEAIGDRSTDLAKS
jgi:hypothetical protein